MRFGWVASSVSVSRPLHCIECNLFSPRWLSRSFLLSLHFRYHNHFCLFSGKLNSRQNNAFFVYIFSKFECPKLVIKLLNEFANRVNDHPKTMHHSMHFQAICAGIQREVESSKMNGVICGHASLEELS